MGPANQITLGRALLTVAIWALIAFGTASEDPAGLEGLWLLCFVAFVLTAVTDILDGWLARRRGQVSDFGRVVDPLVDKMLTIGTMILLLGAPWAAGLLEPWMVAAMLLRELAVTTLRGLVESKGVEFPAVAIGKFKMLVQCLAVGALLVHPLGWGFVVSPIGGLHLLGRPLDLATLLVWSALAITLLSGFVYVRRAVAATRGVA